MSSRPSSCSAAARAAPLPYGGARRSRKGAPAATLPAHDGPRRLARGGGPRPAFDVDGAGVVTGRGPGVLAYAPSFTGGVQVGAGNLRAYARNPSGIATGAGAGGGPHVRVFVFRAATDEVGLGFNDFFAYDPAFRGGVRVGGAAGLIVTGPGPGREPHVRLFTRIGDEEMGFLAYEPAFLGGVFVGVATDAAGQFFVATGAGGGGPLARVFRPTGDLVLGFDDVLSVADVFAFDPAFRGGVAVALGDVGGDGTPELIAGAGPGGGPHVRVLKFDPASGAVTPLSEIIAFAPAFSGGVAVAAVDVDGDGKAEVVAGA